MNIKLLSGALAISGLLLSSAAAQAPGFSAIDRTNQAASNQPANLAPHPTPPTITPLERLPVDKIKVPAGFKAEVYSWGHPGARTMVMGPRGTLFMGPRMNV